MTPLVINDKSLFSALAIIFTHRSQSDWPPRFVKIYILTVEWLKESKWCSNTHLLLTDINHILRFTLNNLTVTEKINWMTNVKGFYDVSDFIKLHYVRYSLCKFYIFLNFIPKNRSNETMNFRFIRYTSWISHALFRFYGRKVHAKWLCQRCWMVFLSFATFFRNFILKRSESHFLCEIQHKI